jgi:flagellar hook-basal body complex protein FliE
MSVPTLTVTPSGAASAYARVQGGALESAGGVGGFGDVLGKALEKVTAAGHDADAQSVRAIAGQGNLTDVATSVSRAELALQTAVAIRDRVVQAYQDVMRMPI